MTRMPAKLITVTFFVAVAVLGMAMRAAHLHFPPMNVDEAESAINALTILQRGYPAGEYLGQPIYENTLIRPWTGHPEYEFRDVSYTDRGIAIYHGWLPLYAMAASFSLFGVEPDIIPDPPRVQHDDAAMIHRVIAARAPSVVFAGAFLAIAYLAGRDMFGAPAGAVAIVIAALAEPCVRVARQARYYSLTLAVATACCWLAWSALRRDRWRDHVLMGLALAVAFHTHLPTFLAGCGIYVCALFVVLRRPGGWQRAAGAGGIVSLGVVPWALAVGFPGPASGIPYSWSLMVFPADLFDYLREQKALAVVVAGSVLLPLVTLVAKRWLPPRATESFTDRMTAVALSVSFVVFAVSAFWLAAPASSAFFWRMALPIQGPAALLGAFLLANVARVLTPRRPTWVAGVAAVALLAGPRSALANLRSTPPFEREPVRFAIEYLTRTPLTTDTRIYALPFQHLPLTFYTGLPVQSIAPVRRSFLDSYPGPIILLDNAARRRQVPREWIESAARDAGVQLSTDDVRRLTHRVSDRLFADDLKPTVAHVAGMSNDPLPAFALAVLDKARTLPPPRERSGRWQNPAMFRGHEVYHMADFWPIFFYRFVDPDLRRGANLNYARRLATATATILPAGWVAYRSPPLSGTRHPQQ